MSRQNRRLRAKDRIRLSPGGPVYNVVRVNDCAAYVRREYETPRKVTVPAKVDGEGNVLTPARQFEVNAESSVLAISPYSFVERVTESASPVPTHPRQG